MRRILSVISKPGLSKKLHPLEAYTYTGAACLCSATNPRMSLTKFPPKRIAMYHRPNRGSISEKKTAPARTSTLLTFCRHVAASGGWQ
jgi:hypothetical protein